MQFYDAQTMCVPVYNILVIPGYITLYNYIHLWCMEGGDRLCLFIKDVALDDHGSRVKVKGQGSGMQLLVSLHLLLPLDNGSVLLLDLVDPVVQRTLTLLAVLWLLCMTCWSTQCQYKLFLIEILYKGAQGDFA